MGLFRRRRPLHEELARAGDVAMSTSAGGFLAQPPDLMGNERAGIVGIHGVPRPRRWDVVVSARAPEVEGREVKFVELPDRSLVVDEEVGDVSLDPLAAAVEEELAPPFRAHAVRQSESVWAVSANRIDVAEFDADGDEVELANVDGVKTLTVDGRREFGSIPELERLGSRDSADYVVRATRLEGNLWEVEASAL